METLFLKVVEVSLSSKQHPFIMIQFLNYGMMI